jgi:hypothetical protein
MLIRLLSNQWHISAGRLLQAIFDYDISSLLAFSSDQAVHDVGCMFMLADIECNYSAISAR